CIRIILPVAVTLKRLAAPRWVLSFFFGFDALRGIAAFLRLFVSKLSRSLRFCVTIKKRPPRKATATTVTATAARWQVGVWAVLLRLLPSSEPTARPGRCLPCAAWSRSGMSRRFRPAGASSSRGLLPDVPFRGRDEKSWREPCDLLPGTE